MNEAQKDTIHKLAKEATRRNELGNGSGSAYAIGVIKGMIEDPYFTSEQKVQAVEMFLEEMEKARERFLETFGEEKSREG